MRLLSFREHVNTGGTNEAGGAMAGWRWSLEVERWSIGLFTEGVYRDGPELGWRTMTTGYFLACVNEHWAWGSEHMYYDGPHCSFSIGPLHISWSYWWCDRCHKGE